MINKYTAKKKLKILVVEDEILLAQDIIQRLTAMNYDVVGLAMTANSALELINENPKIDILLIDIKIQGNKDGIELAKLVKKNIPIIFLTSNTDQQIIERANDVNPYAYILKPFNSRQVGITIELAFLNALKNKKQLNQEESNVKKIKSALFLKKNSHFKRVALNEILYVKADNNYSTVYTKKEKFLYAIVMKKIEEKLPKHLFLRIHRSYIVNKKAIDGFEGNMLFVDKNKIPISKSHKENVFKLFNTI